MRLAPEWKWMERLFDLFGRRRSMQVIASTVIGTLIGVRGAVTKATSQAQVAAFVLGGAAIGFAAGAVLAFSERQVRSRVFRMGTADTIILVFLLVIAFCLILVFVMH